MWPLRLLICVAPLMFLNAQLRFAFTALDEQRKYGVLIGWVLASKVIAGLILIPLWGIYGACVGYMFGELLLCVAGLGMLKRLGIAGPRWTQVARDSRGVCHVSRTVAGLGTRYVAVVDGAVSPLFTLNLRHRLRMDWCLAMVGFDASLALPYSAGDRSKTSRPRTHLRFHRSRCRL